MRKYLSIMMLLFTGCASMHSQVGAIPNGLIYEHRIPRDPKVTQVVTDDKGIVRQVIPWGEVTENSAKIGNSVANIVQAVKGNFGFPFGILPDMLGTTLKESKKFQKETSEQEIFKLYWVQGMNNVNIELPDKTKLKVNYHKDSNA